MFDDNKKIGIGLCLLGMFCLFLGVMLIFDRFLLSIGNVSFLMGLCFLLGLQKTGKFFLRKEKAVGTSTYFAGIALILYGFAFFGFLLQLYGFWKLFSSFIPNVIQSLKMIPGVNVIFNLPVIGKFMNMVNDSQKRLPV
jgi:hypothetical protein